MKRIGILGGTFNPPHQGHLIIAEYVRVELDLEEVWFIPTYKPPHKQEANTDAASRVNMLEKAIEDNSAFHLNGIEIEREGKSYTIETIKYFKQKHPDHEYYFIIGADMVDYLPHWHQIDQLIDQLQFVGVKRTGYQLDSPYPVIPVDAPLIDISSTEIRNRLKDGKSIKYMVPEKVYAYIKENQLYGDK